MFPPTLLKYSCLGRLEEFPKGATVRSKVNSDLSGVYSLLLPYSMYTGKGSSRALLLCLSTEEVG